MSYTVQNFKHKKTLKDAVKNYIYSPNKNAPAVRCYNPGLGPDLSNFTGTVSLEGPHARAMHTWYAQGEMKNGVLVKVK